MVWSGLDLPAGHRHGRHSYAAATSTSFTTDSGLLQSATARGSISFTTCVFHASPSTLSAPNGTVATVTATSPLPSSSP